MNKEELLLQYLDELTIATQNRDEYEIEYETEKARMLFSAEIGAMSNQSLRDARAIELLDEKGMYRKMAELRTDARIAYYKWATMKSLVDRRFDEKSN